MNTPRTIIEFTDVNPNPLGHVAHTLKEIRINGAPVLVAEDGIDIEFGHGEVTAVTLRLLPTEIHFRSAPPYREL